jgi:tyrosyl-DNA phosphodiesterase 1
MLTSANLSKQAWGDVALGTGEVRIASYEVGVLLWPKLVTTDPTAVMRPAFKKDSPVTEPSDAGNTVIGVRIPYNLPLQPYGSDEVPWVASMDHREKDWKGQAWGGS